MKHTAGISLVVLAGFVGCATPPPAGSRSSAVTENRTSSRSEAAPERAAQSRTTMSATGQPVEMEAYEVREAAFTDFGMSVRTNLAVKWGEPVEWMKVIGVQPESSAASQNLRPGDRIMAIDGQPVTKFDRDAMLEVLFQRKSGDRAELLLLGAGQVLPRFVTLTAAKPRLAK